MQTESDARLVEIKALGERLDAVSGKAPTPATQQVVDPLDDLRKGVAALEALRQQIADMEARRGSMDTLELMGLAASRQTFAGMLVTVRDQQRSVERSIRDEDGRQRLHGLLSGNH